MVSLKSIEIKKDKSRGKATLVLGECQARWVVYDNKTGHAAVQCEEEWHWDEHEDNKDQALSLWLRERCERDGLQMDKVRVLLNDGSLGLSIELERDKYTNKVYTDELYTTLKPIVMAPEKLRTVTGMLRHTGIRPEQVQLKEDTLFEVYSHLHANNTQERITALFSLEPGAVTVACIQKDSLLSARRIPIDTDACDLVSPDARKKLLKKFTEILNTEKRTLGGKIDVVRLATDEPGSIEFCKYLTARLKISVLPWNISELDFVAAEKKNHADPKLRKLRDDIDKLLLPPAAQPTLKNKLGKSVKSLVVAGATLVIYLGSMIWSLFNF